MTLFWCPSGPKISYHRDAFREWFVVEDLNPENSIEFSLTPIELLKLGFQVHLGRLLAQVHDFLKGVVK